MKQNTISTLDKGRIVGIERSLCRLCKNLLDIEKQTCKAFPQGIPNKYTTRLDYNNPIEHSTIDNGQVGEYIFAY